MATQFDALVMYQRDHKERDLMVKMLTKGHGKRMFYIRNGKTKRYPYAAEILPLTYARYEGTINRTGLSFMNEVKQSRLPRPLLEDVQLNAYMTVVLGLIDAAFVDNEPLDTWFELAVQAQQLLADQVLDPQGVMNYIEVKLLPVFGVQVGWGACMVCGREQGPFDFSERYGGALCSQHWGLDEHRMHVDPKAMHVLNIFDQVPDLTQIQSLTLAPETKVGMSRILDRLYSEQVGVQLKAKRFLQQLTEWQSRVLVRSDDNSIK